MGVQAKRKQADRTSAWQATAMKTRRSLAGEQSLNCPYAGRSFTNPIFIAYAAAC